MDQISLTTFSAVAELGSVSAAAKALHTVQSNVTARLKQLETELDVILFERHSRGMHLTTAGTTLLGYAKRLTELSKEARAAVRTDGKVNGALKLGSMETTAAVRLPAVLSRFHKAFPDVELDISTGPTAELVERVLNRRLDAALVAGPIDHPDLKTTRIFKEELVLIAAKGGSIEETQSSSGGLTAIVFRQGCSYRQRLEELFTSRGWLPFRRLELGTLEGVLGCVGAGVGVTVLPRSAVENYRNKRNLQIVKLGTKQSQVETLLIKRTDTFQSSALQEFSAML